MAGVLGREELKVVTGVQSPRKRQPAGESRIRALDYAAEDEAVAAYQERRNKGRKGMP